MKKKVAKAKESNEGLGLSGVAKQFLDKNKKSHFNYDEDKGDYKISTGSLIFDSKIGGGIEAGLVRFTGNAGGGKTSEALLLMKNFLETVPNSRGLFVKAEGRLHENIKNRSGIEFVTDPEAWREGNCFVFECNVYDVVFDFIRHIWKNQDGTRFCIVIDSMDGLMSADDLAKATSEANKVAAGASLTSDFLKRVSLGMAKKGHLCLMLSQLRAEIKASQFATTDKNKMGGATGGNALAHYPDWVFEFMKPTANEHRIREGGENDKNGRIIGHTVRVAIHKSTNESTGTLVSYPVRYGRSEGLCVWRTREVADLLIAWAFLKRVSAAWYEWDEGLSNKMKEKNIDFPEKINGIGGVYAHLEENKPLYDFLNDFCVKEVLPNAFSELEG